MNNSEYNFLNFDSEDCTSRGTCTLSPGIVSLQELVLYFLRGAAYYIVKLKEFKLHNAKIEDEIIDSIASLVYINDYSEKQLYELAMRCYYIFENSKSRYKLQCMENDVEPGFIKEVIAFGSNFSLANSISCGDALIKHFYNIVSSENRNFSYILYAVLKSVCLNISKLFDFGFRQQDAILDILHLLSVWIDEQNNKDKLSDFINSLSLLDYRLQLSLVDTLIEHYGKISEVMVSHSTQKGKCILVSGSNFNDLIQILEQTRGENIDVYTHSGLLISHCFENFRKYPHLKGHYGRSSENCIVDYGTFPGAILLTKNSKNNTEYLYRGKIYSNDYITPQGVIKIENNDYEPVIKTAKNVVGFKKGRQKPDSNLGFNENDVDKLVDKLLERLASGKIRRLFIIGINSYSAAQKEYFERFFHNLRNDEFALSFYYESNKNNVVTINIGNYVPLVVYISNKLFLAHKYFDKMYFIFPTCDVASISGIIKLKNIGFNNIYIAACSPRVVNPSVFSTFTNFYGINVATEPLKDLKNIRKRTF